MMLRSELAAILEGTLHGEDAPVAALRDPDDAQPQDVVCVLRDKYLSAALESPAGLLVLNGSAAVDRAHIRVSDIEIAWVKLLRAFSPKLDSSGIHPSAVVHPEAHLEPDVQIGAGAVVARGARIARRTVIGALCSIGENTVIGEDSQLLERVTVRHHCALGKRVLVQSGAVIGADGFGFYRTADSRHIRQEQIGTVRIEDDVEIGANCVIDRGTLGETRIGARSKLGPACIIAHNCQLGEDVILIGAVQLAGSVTIKNRAVLWGQVGSIGHLTIGEGAVVTAQSGISKDVPDGATWRGSPAQDIKTQLRLEARFMALETMEKRLKALENQIFKPDSGAL
jgi:UDP-3-O-[3-hydroxymyristoyl] glucosamine N-acyltransferase